LAGVNIAGLIARSIDGIFGEKSFFNPVSSGDCCGVIISSD
jgi:hypothetical protein